MSLAPKGFSGPRWPPVFAGGLASRRRGGSQLITAFGPGFAGEQVRAASIPVKTGLALWVRGDTLADGGNATWSDLSGNKNDLKTTATNGAPTAGSSPTSQAGTLGKRTLKFNGTNQCLSSVALPIADSDDYSIFLVGDKSAAVSRGYDGQGGWSITVAAGNHAIVAGGVQYNSLYTFDPFSVGNNSLLMLTALRDRAGAGTISAYLNGNLAATSAATANALRNSSTYFTVSWFNGGFQGPDTVAEIAVYNRLLSSSEISQVHGYLRGRWQLP